MVITGDQVAHLAHYKIIRLLGDAALPSANANLVLCYSMSCLKEIGLHAQNIIAILGSTCNIIGVERRGGGSIVDIIVQTRILVIAMLIVLVNSQHNSSK